MCTNQDISNIPFIMRGNHFLVHGHKKDLPHNKCIFHLLKCVVKHFLVSAILHHISFLRLLPKSYFKISFFQPNFLCSGSFKLSVNTLQMFNNVSIILHFTLTTWRNCCHDLHMGKLTTVASFISHLYLTALIVVERSFILRKYVYTFKNSDFIVVWYIHYKHFSVARTNVWTCKHHKRQCD